jgi:hypothetical protein
MADNSKSHSWNLRSQRINELVDAPDQFIAWDTLRDRPVGDFGLVVEAEPNGNGNPIVTRTSMLMFRWNRDEDARRFIRRASALLGVPDTSAEDLAAAGRNR